MVPVKVVHLTSRAMPECADEQHLLSAVEVPCPRPFPPYRRRHELRPYAVRQFEQALPVRGFGIARKLRLLKDLTLDLPPNVWALIKVDAVFLDADRGGVPGAYGTLDDKTPPP